MNRVRIVRRRSTDGRRLVGNLGGVGRIHQPLDHHRIHIRTAEHHRAAAQLDVALLALIDRRAVGGVRHVDRNADVRVDAERAGPG